MIGTEFRLFLRDPMSTLLSLLLPVGILVIFGIIPDVSKPSAEYGGHSALDTVLPSAALALTVGMLGLFVLPTTLTLYREKGILRRLATTPVPPSALLRAQLVVNLTMMLLSTALVIGVGVVALGMSAPAGWAWLALVLTLGAAAMLAFGLIISAVAKSSKVATGLGFLAYYPLAFLAGVLVPREQLPHAVQVIGDWTPLGAFRLAVQAAWSGDAPSAAGLAIMAGYTIMLGALAARFFRWE
ncbi:ABC transporter permease [Longispora sp. NPDC051575]|uniref:ABC transporter permease n=1 Tax=Longispora sp. NPDC051575 TaxID=3154943 RepID=UPI0034340EB7